jgi:hypothetical protein
MSLDLQHADADTAQAASDAAAAEIELGAHLVTQRAGYSHHGIYAGNGQVIHYSGLCTSLHRGPVEEVTLERFAAGHQVFIAYDRQARYAGIEAVERARSRLGENDYRLLTNNCEHFCTWCVCGKGRSEQVRACVTHPAMAARAVMGMCRALMAARRAARRQYVSCAACALQAA